MRKHDTVAFRVLAWPNRSPSNVYTGSLNSALGDQPGIVVDGLRYSWKQLAKLLIRPPHVIHVHWFERAFWAPDKRRALKQAFHVSAAISLLKLRGSRLVWTAHDPEPHRSPLNRWLSDESTVEAWRSYERKMLFAIDGILLMSASHRPAIVKRAARLASVPMEVVPHPHYLGQYPDKVNRTEARASLGISQDADVAAFIGSLRAYKNPEGLISAFAKVPGDVVLLVAGEAETPEREQFLRKLAEADSRIRLQTKFVPDDELATWLRAADVSVLPYSKVTNSGSAHLALSFDSPVLVPDEPVFRELEQMVGPTWVRRYEGSISPEAIADALTWARSAREISPDLTALDWETIAERTLSFYKRVAGSAAN